MLNSAERNRFNKERKTRTVKSIPTVVRAVIKPSTVIWLDLQNGAGHTV